MRRRQLLALLGSAIALPPRNVLAEEKIIPVVGWLAGPPLNASPALPYFRQGIADLGYVEGKTVRIEYRSAEFHPDRFPALAAELVKLQVSVIAAVSGLPAALAAKQATATIPIVFLTPSDPVQLGLVVSLGRPGGNLTGLTVTNNKTVQKQIEIMDALLPKSAPIAVLSDPSTEAADLEASVKEASVILGRQLFLVAASNGGDFESAFAEAKRRSAAGIVIPDRPLFVSLHVRLATLADKVSIPAMYPNSNIASSGGLISYGANTLDTFRQVGQYVGRILAGANPADMPVEQAMKIELKVNLKTAKALGITVPLSVLARADEVIE